MGTFANGESGSSVRTKINAAIQKTEGTSAISTIDVDGGAIDGVTLGTNSAVTEAQVDNININGHAITSTDTNGNIALTPNGSGEVDISKVDIDSGAIDGVTIGTNSAVTDLRVDNLQLDGNTVSSTNLNGDITIDPNGTGDVNIGNFKFDADQTIGAGQDNYVLTYDNAGGKISLEVAPGAGGGISNVIEDATPQLGGDLDVNGNSIVSVTNGNIAITPNGTGKTATTNLTYNEVQYASLGTTGTLTPDPANGSVQKITLTGNITINALGGTPAAGDSVTLIIVQPSSGNYTLTSTMKFAGGTKTLSTTSNYIDVLTIYYDGTNYLANLATNFS